MINRMMDIVKNKRYNLCPPCPYFRHVVDSLEKQKRNNADHLIGKEDRRYVRKN